MKALRTTLIVFGWLIPLVSLLLFATTTFSAVTYAEYGNSDRPSLLLTTVISNAARTIQSLALSPLCFFGAYMLGKRGGYSND